VGRAHGHSSGLARNAGEDARFARHHKGYNPRGGWLISARPPHPARTSATPGAVPARGGPDAAERGKEGEDSVADWYETVFEVIDMRSFSNLWFWIAVAVTWSTTSHYVLGVPYDLVTRARRSGGEAEHDLRDMVRVNVNRLLYIASAAGNWLVGIAFCLLTTLALTGFVYGVEFAQAVFLLACPMSLVFALSIRTARAIRAADGAGLHEALRRHRFLTQVVGICAIFVTAFWGMWQNISVGPI
jgi:hypothetical protein